MYAAAVRAGDELRRVRRAAGKTADARVIANVGLLEQIGKALDLPAALRLALAARKLVGVAAALAFRRGLLEHGVAIVHRLLRVGEGVASNALRVEHRKADRLTARACVAHHQVEQRLGLRRVGEITQRDDRGARRDDRPQRS